MSKYPHFVRNTSGVLLLVLAPGVVLPVKEEFDHPHAHQERHEWPNSVGRFSVEIASTTSGQTMFVSLPSSSKFE